MSDDARIKLPEQSPQFGAGFLAELWRQDKPLPRIEGSALYWYYLRRAVDTLLSLPGSNAVTAATIAA